VTHNKNIHLVLDVVEGIPRVVLVIELTVPAVVLLGYGLAQVAVHELEEGARILRRLEEAVDEQKLVENAAGEGEAPEGGVRPQEGAVRHDGHAQGHPEEGGRHEAAFSVVHGVLHRRFCSKMEKDIRCTGILKYSKKEEQTEYRYLYPALWPDPESF
jgi:hypothetical protein